MYVHFNWQNFSGVSELLSFPPQVFFWLKMQHSHFFEDKRVLHVVFIELKCRWLQTGQADLENTKYLYFSKGRYLMHF